MILLVDTFRSEIALRSVDNGADIINDISAGNLDKEMFDVVAGLNIPLHNDAYARYSTNYARQSTLRLHRKRSS